MKKILVIGGVAGGATAAARLCRCQKRMKSSYLSETNIFLLTVGTYYRRCN